MISGPNELKLSDRGWPRKTQSTKKAQRPASVRWSAWLDDLDVWVSDELLVGTVGALEEQPCIAAQGDGKLVAAIDTPRNTVASSEARQWSNIGPPRIVAQEDNCRPAIDLDHDTALTGNDKLGIKAELQIKGADTDLIELPSDELLKRKIWWNGSYGNVV